MNQQEFCQWEAVSRDTIDVKRVYIDLAGDLVAGILLSQIIYWHLPGKDGKPRLRVRRHGHSWLAKRREDWWEEVRITTKQFDRAIKILEDLGFVETAVYRFGGSPTKHIRILWESFLEALVTERGKSTLPKGKERSLPKVNMESDQTGIICSTEITTEITTENTAVAATAAKKTEPTTSHPDQADWTAEDHDSFECVLYSWTKEFGKLTPRQVEKMIRLWNLYPEEEIHEYAWNEMIEARDKRKVRPNLAYYEKCLETEARTNWVVNEGGNGHGET